MSLRVLVAGATGYVGRHVAREFQRRGHRVRALVRDAAKLRSIGVTPDEVRVGDVTRPDSLVGVCDDVEIVFSCIGQMRPGRGPSFDDVDLRGNEALLDRALAAGARRFMYVACFRGESLRHLAVVRAHEAFVETLVRAPIAHVVLRPTGFFSDMDEFFAMARAGRVLLLGTGDHCINPIHGADLAAVCADSITRDDCAIEVGGPEVLSYRQIAHLAFAALGRAPHITSVPAWVHAPAVHALRPLSANAAGLVQFLSAVTQMDSVAPLFGSHRLAEHYAKLARGEAS
jgi:uncharacterized protein YbjT (DUF2867 family)